LAEDKSPSFGQQGGLVVMDEYKNSKEIMINVCAELLFMLPFRVAASYNV